MSPRGLWRARLPAKDTGRPLTRDDQEDFRREVRRALAAGLAAMLGVGLCAVVGLWAINKHSEDQRRALAINLCHQLQGYVGQLVPRDRRAADLLVQGTTPTARELGRLFRQSQRFGARFAEADCEHLASRLVLPEPGTGGTIQDRPNTSTTARAPGATASAPQRAPVAPAVPRRGPGTPSPAQPGTGPPSAPSPGLPARTPTAPPALPPVSVPTVPAVPPVAPPAAPPPPVLRLPCLRLGLVQIGDCTGR